MKKYLLFVGASVAAMGMVVGSGAFATIEEQGNQATAEKLAAYASSQLSQVPSSAKSSRIIKWAASSVTINVSTGAGDTQEQYHLVITNFQLTSSGVAHARGPAVKALFDSKADFQDLLNGKLSFVDALSKDKLKLKGVGLFNRLKISLLVPAIKKMSKEK